MVNFKESDALASAACKTCVAGQYAVSASVPCKNCELGKIQELSEAVEYSCKFCEKGKSFGTTATTCSDCLNGQFQESDALSKCCM